MEQTLQKNPTPTPFRAFRNSAGSCKMHMPSGKEIVFASGKHVTKDFAVIGFLADEIASGNPYLKEIPVDETPVATGDVMAALRQRIIAEEIAAGRIALNKGDMGTSEQGKLNAGNSRTVAAVTGGSLSLEGGPVSASVPVQSQAQLDAQHGTPVATPVAQALGRAPTVQMPTKS